MQIKEIPTNKADYMDILLIGDEEEEKMINKYIEQSTLFVLFDNNILTSVCAVITIDKETIEIKISRHILNIKIWVMLQH